MEETTIRISEIFPKDETGTFQGEGLRNGCNSVFVRVATCNLKCPGFGLNKGEQNTEIPAIVKRYQAGEFKHYDDLPLSKTGCDSYPSSWSQFKDLNPELTFNQLAERIANACGDNPRGVDLVITGGEPLLKPTQRKLVEFFKQYSQLINSFKCLTFETNVTQIITEEMCDWLVNRCEIPVIFSVSPKLECSGEPEKRRLVPAAMQSMKEVVGLIGKNQYYRNPSINVPDACVYLKYVVKDEDDVVEALDNAIKLGFDRDNDGDIYLMPVGGTYDEYMTNQKKIAELAWKSRCKFCCRTHLVVFANCWGK